MSYSASNLFVGTLYKQLILLVRYPLNTVTHVLTMYLLFLIVFVGGRATVGAALTDSLEGVVVGFFLISVANSIYSSIAWWITMESQWGTLEQLYMSPFGFGTVVTARVTVSVLQSVLTGSVILVMMMVTTGRFLSVDVVTVAPLLLFTLAPAVGMGFALGGLALLYKRVENVFNLVEWVVLVLVAASITEFEWMVALPFGQGTALLRSAMAEGTALWEFPVGDLAILVVTGVAYCALGYACFGWARRRALRLGVMGDY